MIGKIKKGSGFKGCVNYVLGKEQAVLLHADGVLTESRSDIIRSFCMQTGMNPDLKKPVGHIALSYSAVDAPKLTDEKVVQLAQEYMREMKITDTQYIIVRHQDREHPHVHIAVSYTHLPFSAFPSVSLPDDRPAYPVSFSCLFTF